MDIGRFLIETHLRTGRSIKALAKTHEVSPSWLFTLLRRYRLEGDAGLEPRSRRPRSSPSRISYLWEDEIVALRKALVDDGWDAGAQTIRHHLCERHGPSVPSVPTIWRVLRDRGFVTPQPHKRPKSSYTRFVAELPNECWQADMTHVTLRNGTVFEVLNMIDDHSRVCVASRAMVRVKATDVVRVLHKSAERWGYPATFLTDNGLIFTAQRRYGVAGAVEHELFALGIGSKHSRPYHPQTCGKVERFHQTLKQFLGAQEGLETKKHLQRAIGRFVEYYGCKSSGSFGDSSLRDELAIRRLGVNSNLLLAPALLGRGIDPTSTALAPDALRSSKDLDASKLLGGERRTAEGILLVLREQVPEEDHELARHSDRRHVGPPPGPDALGEGVQWSGSTRDDPRRLDEGPASTGTALLGDAAVAGRGGPGLADRRIKAEVAHELPRVGEPRDVADCGHERRRGGQVDAGHRQQEPDRVLLEGRLGDDLVEAMELLTKKLELAETR